MKKILIIEDEVYARKSMKKQIELLLSDKNIEILEASNGMQGLEMVQENHPELVFTDIRMPIMDGLDFLKEVKKNNAEVKVVMISAYADFEYAKKALRYGAEEYLLKPIDEQELRECIGKFEQLKQQVQEHKIYVSEDGLAKYIKKNIFSDTFVKDFVNQNMFRKIFNVFQVMICRFEKNDEPGAETLYKIVREAHPEVFTGFRIIEIQKGSYAIIIHVDGQSIFFQKNMVRILEKQGWNVSIGVSLESDCVEMLHLAYQQAADALECRIFYEDNLLYYQDVMSEHDRSYHISEMQTGFLKMAMEKKNFEKVKTVLQEIYGEIVKQKYISAKSLELFLTQITVIFRQTSDEKSNCHFELMDYKSLNEMKKDIEDKAKLICTKEEEHSATGENTVQIMKEYVKTNFGGDITVKTLAEKVFFMNPAYLSHLFKEKVGESFSTYLCKVRMEKARSFLENSQYSITEIATITGYNDTSQFIRIFKREFGVTPKKYRDEVLKNKMRK